MLKSKQHCCEHSLYVYLGSFTHQHLHCPLVSTPLLVTIMARCAAPYEPRMIVTSCLCGLAQDFAYRSLSLHAAGHPRGSVTHSAIDSKTCRASRQMSSSFLSVASDPFMLCICFCVAETQVRKLPGLTASPVDVCCDVLQHSHVYVLFRVQYVRAKALSNKASK